MQIFLNVVIFRKKRFDGNIGEGRARDVYVLLYVTSWNRIPLDKLTVPSMLWIPTVYYRVYKISPPVLILSQISTVHALSADFFKIYFNTKFPFTPESSKWFLSTNISYQNPVYTSPPSHTYHMNRSFRPFFFY